MAPQPQILNLRKELRYDMTATYSTVGLPRPLGELALLLNQEVGGISAIWHRPVYRLSQCLNVSIQPEEDQYSHIMLRTRTTYRLFKQEGELKA
jgi:hypothetical protein